MWHSFQAHHAKSESACGDVLYAEDVTTWTHNFAVAELLGRKTLFPGKDYVDMLRRIVEKIGNPSIDDQDHVSEKAKNFLAGFARQSHVGWKNVYPNASPLALDLLDKLLQFSPKKRLTPEAVSTRSASAKHTRNCVFSSQTL